MGWLENTENENEISNTFARLTGRLRVLSTEFTLYSGTIYYASFTRGMVHTFETNGTSYTLAANIASVSGDQFYYDRDTQRLYINTGGVPSSLAHYIASFYLFYATTETLWYETPTDTTSATVIWQGLIKKPPSFKVTIPPLGLGLFPVDPSGLTLQDDGSLNYVLGKGSFNRTSIEIWEQLGTLEIDNVIKRFTGVTGQRISVQNQEISIDVVDKTINFDEPMDATYYSGTAIDPNYIGRPVMKCWGFGLDDDLAAVFEMVNTNYNSTAPTTSNNRTWQFMAGTDAETKATVNVTLNGTSEYISFTTVDDQKEFFAGDRVWFDGATDQYLIVDTLGSPNGRMFVTSAMSGVDGQAGTLSVTYLHRVFLAKGTGVVKELLYGRDFTMSSGVMTLRSTAEANAGTTTIDPAAGDSLFCMPRGKRVLPTFGGVDYGDQRMALDQGQQYIGHYAQGALVLYDFLKTECGLSEAQIDFPSFLDAQEKCYWDVFLPAPISQLYDTPTKREILDLLLSSMLLRGRFDKDGIFTVKPYQYDIATADGTITKEEISEYKFDIDYSEVTRVRFQSAWESAIAVRFVVTGTKAQILAGTASTQIIVGETPDRIGEATGSDECDYLHKSTKAIVYENIVSRNRYAVSGGPLYDQEAFEARVRDLYGERSGIMRISGKRIGIANEPSDDLTVFRDSMVNLDDAEGNSDQFEVLEMDRANDRIDLGLNDRKAANDKTSEQYWNYDV